MSKLRAYVRRTLIASAREYNGGKRRTAESTMSACQDAMRGTDTGWWTDLIYTVDVLAMFNRNRSEIAAVIREYLSETGCAMGDPAQHGADAFTYADLIAATGRRQTFAHFTGDNEARSREADAAMFAVRFAVEYLAGEIARDLCPNL